MREAWLIVARLDAERIAAWRNYCLHATSIQRRIDQQLVDEHEMPLAWFDCLTALRDLGTEVRVHELCNALQEVPSSFSRRLDRMEDEGLIRRSSTKRRDDRRAVTVSITADGKVRWREASVTYRRMVQQLFAERLTDTDLGALQRMFGKFE